MINGVINVYKEAGFTSFDVVAKLRRILNIKKIGHTGTLDPDAVGVLPVCVGNATRLVDMLTDETKEYVAIMRLGVVTDTQDMSGNVLSTNEESARKISLDEVSSVVSSFRGDILQVPPMYSALKVNGQKLYDLARKGIEVERKARPVTVHNIFVAKLNDLEYSLRVECSKGTYIRTLINDIGEKLGCGASMSHLERTRVGRFKKEDAFKLADIEKMVNDLRGVDDFKAPYDEEVLFTKKVFLKVDSILDKYEAIWINEDGIKALSNGNQLQLSPINTSKNEENINGGDKIEFIGQKMYRVYDIDNNFRAVYIYNSKRKCLEVDKMFM